MVRRRGGIHGDRASIENRYPPPTMLTVSLEHLWRLWDYVRTPPGARNSLVPEVSDRAITAESAFRRDPRVVTEVMGQSSNPLRLPSGKPVAIQSGRPLQAPLLPGELAASIITIGELRAGVLSASDVTTRDTRLATLTAAMTLDPIAIDDDVAAQWARLRVMLRDSGQRMPVNDSWIAATAMALQVPIVTQDDDYVKLAELQVVRV